MDAARAAEARGDIAAALEAYSSLVAATHSPPAAVLLSLALCLRASGASVAAVEARLREALAAAAAEQQQLSGKGGGRRGRAAAAAAAADAAADARSHLALLLLQHAGGASSPEAASLCASLGCRYRLAPLCYSLSTLLLACPVAGCLDGAVPPSLIDALRVAFAPAAPFWAAHDYFSPACGYFSYAMRLDALGSPVSGFEQALAWLAACCVRLRPSSAPASHIEWWAHCRPHSAGHQMHFDSDAEGACGSGGDGLCDAELSGRSAKRKSEQTGPRHPLASLVLFIDAACGGPTLVTPQTRGGARLADCGWLVPPKTGRVAAFDGDVLHGVLPGVGAPADASLRRVTLMIALWDGLQVRPGSQPGAARPMPRDGGASSWLGHVACGGARDEWGARAAGDVLRDCATEVPLPGVEPLWEDVDAAANAAGGVALRQLTGVPPYSECFQGF